MLRKEADLGAPAKVPRYKEADEANSKEFGEEGDAVDWCLQPADKSGYLRKVSD